jgi:hypothetical protein
MCRACSTNWRGRGMNIGYWWERQEERDHLEDQDVDNIKMNLERLNAMVWIDMSQYRNQWRTLVNMVMNLRVP